MATVPLIINTSDLIRRLTAVLIQYQRRPDAQPALMRQFRRFFTPSVAEGETLPVAGVATRGVDQVHLFLTSSQIRIDRHEFDTFFGTEDMDVQTRYTGPFVPCAQGGDSIGFGSPAGATGTLGCIVSDVAKDEYLLSCNHVLANLNSAKIGDPVWAPGSGDGGTPTDRIGCLSDIETIHMGGVMPNHMDAALAKPDSQASLSRSIRGGIGIVGGTYPGPFYNATVKKFGKSTGLTQADLIFDDMSFVMSYAVGQALFVKQYGIVEATGGVFAGGGDSGSLVVSLSNEAVGLLFGAASQGNVAIVSPIDRILTRFGVSF